MNKLYHRSSFQLPGGRFPQALGCAAIALFLVAAPGLAGYKARPWIPRASDGYAAKLASEGVTIAVEPLFRDALASQVFDKDDIVTRGIMPLAIVVFNDNDFPVRVEATSIELLEGDDHTRTLMPNEVVSRLFQRGGRSVWLPQPLPRMPGGERLNPEALNDLERKFLGVRTIPPHANGGGFLYLHLPVLKDLPAYLSRARVYIPDIYREDTASKMIFFEIDLQPAVDGVSRAIARP